MRPIRIFGGVVAGLLLVLSCDAADPVEMGLSKADVIQRRGKPTSSAGKGAREFLTYPDGRVILENGVVTGFEPAKGGSARPASASSTSTAASAPAKSSAPDPMQPKVDARAAKAGWLSSMDDAVAKATAANKPILFLLSGDMVGCPWGRMFNDTVEYSNHFVRKIQAEYIPLRISLTELGGDIEVSSITEATEMVGKLKAFEHMRAEIFSSEMIPGLAILSPDGKQSTEVDMTGAIEAVARGKLDEYTLAQMKAARDGPRKSIQSYQSAAGKMRLLYLAAGIIVVVLVIKKIAG